MSLLGYVTVISGSLTVTDPVQSGFAISQATGIYPIYCVIDSANGLKALYIDLPPEDPAV
ncbi:hypothetical protein [Methanocrinis sp.]|uniref:hypothetical protein n=1 Tax=Methanocrinis sp. TaxID=3101522 RepID=UPI003D0B621A